MSERNDDGKIGAFLLGFILGVVVCLGAGGVYMTYHFTQRAHLEEQLRAEAEAARARAEQALYAARVAAAHAEMVKEKEKVKEKDAKAKD